MTIHILVEGPSERAFLDRWAKRLLKGVPFRVHPHQGKGKLPRDGRSLDRPDRKRRGLLDQLPAKLRAFANSLDPDQDAVLVVVDADADDPSSLAREIRDAIQTAKLRADVALAIEETEAFYLGDLAALARAFPDADLDLAAEYEPDSVCGTWETFGRVIGDGGENKVAWAEAMGPAVTTRSAQSRSPSFRRLIAALLGLAPRRASKGKRKPYRHPSKRRADGTGRR